MKMATFPLILAGLLIVAPAPASAGSKKEEAQKLMKRLAKDKDPEMRASAAESLGNMGATDAVLPLAAALADRDASVRAAAAASLWKLKEASKDAEPALRKALDDPDPIVAWNAAGALHAGLGVVTTDLLPVYKKLMDEDDCDIRVSAAQAAQEYVSPKDVLAVAFDCRRTDDVHTSNEAATLLSETLRSKDKRLVGDLAALTESGSVTVRREAAHALGEMGPRAKEAVSALKAALKDRDTGVRIAAEDALARIEKR